MPFQVQIILLIIAPAVNNVVYLVLQGTRGGQLEIRNDSMMAGITFQVVVLYLFAVLVSLYLPSGGLARSISPASWGRRDYTGNMTE
ncbi:hypothetical protein N7539_003243 [Penicillium diatomitis]|uniref:Uncharacterized protein n=1 Tax=Penicillium diatomitis TaxID=2819901 RepID=A0A9W9XG83_9EURO|nr:uncharacterized protein N7539_003243 [Penicillium diatomitis]KAJ5491676.1 hypothetical protein N7539_003243 [Penicillium diatomitis]